MAEGGRSSARAQRPPDARAARFYSSADIIAGLICIVIGLFFAIPARSLGIGSLLAMGPGYFPFAVAAILCILGVIILVRAFVSPSTELGLQTRVVEPLRFGAIPWRALICVCGALALFAFTIDGLGLFLAGSLTGILACLARPEISPLRAVLTAVPLTLVSYLIFVVGLGLDLPAIGPWLGG